MSARTLGTGRRVSLVIAVLMLAASSAGAGQERMAAPRSRAGAPLDVPEGAQPLDAPQTLSPGEIQRLFDAYAVVQAQESLKLQEAQYAQFVSRLKALQEIRRRNQQERGRLLQELNRLSNQSDPPADDTLLRDRLKALHDLEMRSASDVRRGYEGVDQVLDLRQQARFRVFEEQLERRKFELLMRARQMNRLNRQGRLPPK